MKLFAALFKGKDKTSGFEDSPLPKWIFDKQSLRFLAVNKAAIQLYGYSEEEFTHMTIRDIRPVWDVKKLEEHINHHALYGRNTGTWKHLTKGGDILNVTLAAEDILHNGQMQRIITVESFTHT